MTTDQVVAAVAEQEGLSKAKAREMLDRIFTTFIKAAEEDGEVRFGKHRFYKKVSPAGAFYNIQANEIQQKPEKVTIRYKFAV